MEVTTDVVIKSFNGIGDLLFVTPTLSRIKEVYPNIQITVNTNYPQLLYGNPFVDNIGSENEGVFLGYPDPIHRVNPTRHHILSDWDIVMKAYGLSTEPPELRPEIYIDRRFYGKDIGVQVIHKGHWNQKKVWPSFHELCLSDKRIFPIPRCDGVIGLVKTLSLFKLLVCSEGGISHIARAMGIPCIVIYGGFAKPEWNGYMDGGQINLTNEYHCSYCYHPGECVESPERKCMREITVDHVLATIKSTEEEIKNGAS